MATNDGCRVLLVCHANICRSPMAERLARQALRRRLGPSAATVQVRSAGTHAPTGRPMHPNTARVLRERGADASGFRSCRLTAELLASTDLVLTMDRRQRADCVTLTPATVHRTYTLKQFGRLASAVLQDSLVTAGPPYRRLLALREEVVLVRGDVPFVADVEDDLTDPVLAPVEEFARCADDISQVLKIIVDLIAPV